MKTLLILASACLLTLFNSGAHACEQHEAHHHSTVHSHNTAPISVMNSHLHEQGDWMISYRPMRMEMNGMRSGTSSISPESIVGNATAFPNPNAPPAGFRVVPDKMRMDMHMFGAMYGATDWLTLMAMGQYVEKEMNHITFQGMIGITRLGEFKTQSQGFGDSSLSGLMRLYDDERHRVHANVGISIPTGSITKSDQVLTPMNTTPNLRLPYAMQLGSGTYDAKTGVTYNGAEGLYSWGTQYNATIRLENENDEGYALGNVHRMDVWAGYQFLPWLNATARIGGIYSGDIDGRDAMIIAPVTSADTDNYGGKTVEAGLGFKITPPVLDGVNIAAEFAAPIYQNLNGVQMERDYSFTLGLQYSF